MFIFMLFPISFIIESLSTSAARMNKEPSVLRHVMLQAQLTFKTLVTLITWKRNACVFSHVVSIVSRDGEASLTLVTPEFKLALMVLHVTRVTRPGSEPFLAFLTDVLVLAQVCFVDGRGPAQELPCSCSR